MNEETKLKWMAVGLLAAVVVAVGTAQYAGYLHGSERLGRVCVEAVAKGYRLDGCEVHI